VLFPEAGILGRYFVSYLLPFFDAHAILFSSFQNVAIILDSALSQLEVLLVSYPFLSAALAFGFFLTLFVF
jgi:hypothetical protein